MTESAIQDGLRLGDLLSRQRDLYMKLRDLASEQRSAISHEKPEHLLRILGDRQRRITELTEVDVEVSPYRARWNDIREKLSVSQRQKVSDLVGAVQGLLKDILQQDQGDCDTLKERSESHRAGAATVTFGKQLNVAYAAGRYGGGQARYIDRKDNQGVKQ